MESVIIRAYQLRLSDIFKKESVTYKVSIIDETGIYYSPISNAQKTKEYCNRLGPVSHEMIELIERSNHNE